MRFKGFTLIELLIVIAIILILIAIALPNFLEAQLRAKLTLARGNMTALRTALTSYQIDYKKFPPDEYKGGDYWVWVSLTTPIPYIKTVLPNPFPSKNLPKNPFSDIDTFAYINWDSLGEPIRSLGLRAGIQWFISSAGPNFLTDFIGFDVFEYKRVMNGTSRFFYSPTNGTTSSGDLMLTNGAIR